MQSVLEDTFHTQLLPSIGCTALQSCFVHTDTNSVYKWFPLTSCPGWKVGFSQVSSSLSTEEDSHPRVTLASSLESLHLEPTDRERLVELTLVEVLLVEEESRLMSGLQELSREKRVLIFLGLGSRGLKS